jgi:hypothetical protein
MSMLGDPPEDWLGRVLRYFGYFLFGTALGLLPAAFLIATASTPHIAWKIPILIVVSSGSVFCVLGILTRGSFLGWLLRLLGKDIDSGL